MQDIEHLEGSPGGIIRGSLLICVEINVHGTSRSVVKLLSDIGYRVKCIRKENNLNQIQFAKSIGISQGNLSEIEIGNSNPSAETLISIRTQYNVNLNWLLTGVAADDGTTYEDEFEKRLIEVFRNLDDYDKNEIIEFIRVKINLRSILLFSGNTGLSLRLTRLLLEQYMLPAYVL